MLVLVPARADVFSALESCCVLGRKAVISGTENVRFVVLSDFEDVNVAMNSSASWQRPGDENERTVYVQLPEGGRGLRLVFDNPLENRLRRGDLVTMNLNGCKVQKADSFDALTVYGLSALNILWYERAGMAVQPRQKKISELTSADIWTLVTVTDVDFPFKNGAFMNVDEFYTQYVPSLHPGMAGKVLGRMDSGECYLRDVRGDGIHMGINTRCEWRRKIVPSGSGSITGILTVENNRRWGYGKEKMVIRPRSQEDIAVSGKRKDSRWKSLTAWHPEEMPGKNLDFEKAGNIEKTSGDRCLSSDGALAYLWTDSKATLKRSLGLNSSVFGKETGVSKGAIEFLSKNEDWWHKGEDGKAEGYSIFVEFSPKKVKAGSPMTFCFNWYGGNDDLHNSRYFPARWKLLCSIDGGPWTECRTADGDNTAALRPKPGKDFVSKAGNPHHQPQDSSIGLQEHVFVLPKAAAGSSTVVLRLTPATTAVFYFDTARGMKVDAERIARFQNPLTMPDKRNFSTFRIENIQIDYLQ